MSLSAGTRLGAYEILGLLGAGGMGEVYRARDTRLGRTVAIKILSSGQDWDAQARDRFEREARTISSLDHPHICALFDVGDEQGTPYLVMPLLDGETLADRLRKGALPLDAALRIGVAIAEALAAAHRAGIVHRDVKPGNVMLTKAGARLLDFGLAKPVVSTPGSAASMAVTEAPLTARGSLVGTFEYMAPEQLEGLSVDARSDIWALGCVLYEMVSGRKAFGGSSQASVIGAIMSASPHPLSEVTPLVPAALGRVVQSCLVKDPNDRLQSAQDLSTNLRWLLETPHVEAGAFSRRMHWRTPAAAALVLTVFAAGAGYILTQKSAGPAPPIVRFALSAPENGRFDSTPALSPNAEQVVTVVNNGQGTQRLWLTRFDADDPRALPGTEGAAFPFWSPDGKSIAFFADGKLKRFDLPGGPPLTIADAPSGRGGAWTDDGEIVFAPGIFSGLKAVTASGGTTVDVTTLGPQERSHRFPFLLPGGRIGYRADRSDAQSGIWVLREASGSRSSTRLLESNASAQYAAGYLFFKRDATVLGQRFDASRNALVGDAVVVTNDVAFGGVTSAPAFSVSHNGSIAIRRTIDPPGELREMSRDGRTSDVLNTGAGTFDDIELSPDGRQLAYFRVKPTEGLWVFDLARRTVVPVLTDRVVELPVWSPDGSRIVGSSPRGGGALQLNLYEVPVAGGPATAIVNADHSMYPFAWTSSNLWWREDAPTPLMAVKRMGSDRIPKVYFDPRISIAYARLSPDEQWLAYASDQSGRLEVYVVSATSPGQTRRVSTNGGTMPRWRRDGRELFYLTPERELISVPAHVNKGELTLGDPTALFTARVPTDGKVFDVAEDGNHFFVIVEKSPPTDVLSIVLNWAGAQAKP